MNILIGLVPALFWGILPLWLRKVTGGTYQSQLVGTTGGVLLVALTMEVLCRFPVTPKAFIIFFLSGFFWSFGQAGQYFSYESLGVSLTMPLSTALQVVGNGFIGGILFAEWKGSPRLIFLGVVALFVILVGVILTNKRGQDSSEGTFKNYMILVLSTCGYWLYSALPLLADQSSKVIGFLPQAFGMFLSSILISARERSEILSKEMLKNLSSGVIFAIAAFTYLVAMSRLGMVNAFVLSQLNVVVSTVAAILVLQETDKRYIPRILLGLVLIIAGAALMIMK